MTTTELDTATKRETVRAPKWKNRWIVKRSCYSSCVVCNRAEGHPPGEEVDGCCMIYPTAEEARAGEYRLAAEDGPRRYRDLAYVGPFRVQG